MILSTTCDTHVNKEVHKTKDGLLTTMFLQKQKHNDHGSYHVIDSI